MLVLELYSICVSSMERNKKSGARAQAHPLTWVVSQGRARIEQCRERHYDRPLLCSNAGRVDGGYRDVSRGPRGGGRPYRCRGALLLLLLLATHRHAPHARRRRSCRGTTHHCSATATAGSSGGVCRCNRRGRVSCCRDKVAWLLHRLLLLLRLLLLILLRVLAWHRHGCLLCVLLHTAGGSVTSLLAHRSLLHLIAHRGLLYRVGGGRSGSSNVTPTEGAGGGGAAAASAVQRGGYRRRVLLGGVLL